MADRAPCARHRARHGRDCVCAPLRSRARHAQAARTLVESCPSEEGHAPRSHDSPEHQIFDAGPPAWPLLVHSGPENAFLGPGQRASRPTWREARKRAAARSGAATRKACGSAQTASCRSRSSLLSVRATYADAFPRLDKCVSAQRTSNPLKASPIRSETGNFGVYLGQIAGPTSVVGSTRSRAPKARETRFAALRSLTPSPPPAVAKASSCVTMRQQSGWQCPTDAQCTAIAFQRQARASVLTVRTEAVSRLAVVPVALACPHSRARFQPSRALERRVAFPHAGLVLGSNQPVGLRTEEHAQHDGRNPPPVRHPSQPTPPGGNS